MYRLTDDVEIDIIANIDHSVSHENLVYLRETLAVIERQHSGSVLAQLLANTGLTLIVKRMIWCHENLAPGTFSYEAPKITFDNERDEIMCKLAVG